MQSFFLYYLPMNVSYLSPYVDLCALTLTLALTAVLAVGVKESTRFNNVFTGLNLCVVGFVTIGGERKLRSSVTQGLMTKCFHSGLFYADPRNWALEFDHHQNVPSNSSVVTTPAPDPEKVK